MSDYRILYINDPQSNIEPKFVSNYISTSKYSVFSFLPKFLYEQFSRYANLFFLFTACIQQIPGVSPTNAFTTIIPLLIVLTATAIKELFEDIQRHRMDWETNHRIVLRLDGANFVPIKWNEVVVGDMLRINNDEFFPADLLVISSSEPDGICYVETANLDGETNLKIRQSKKETKDILNPVEASNLHGHIVCEQPNNSLYTFEGVYNTPEGTEIPLGPDQILLRGCQLRNTPWVYGIVIFTGYDTKLFRNSNPAPIKMTKVERFTNFQIVFLFGILVFLSLFGAIANFLWTRHSGQEFWYLDISNEEMSDLGLKTFLNFLTFLILFNNLIPISLIVSMEIVKFQQARMINSDLGMYHAPSDTPAATRTSSLVEELGQVEYIFSDKTGTLTENRMVLKKMSIAGQMFVESKVSNDNEDTEQSIYLVDDGAKLNDIEMTDQDNSERNTDLTFDQLKTKLITNENEMFCLFLTMMAVCHTVIPEEDPKNPGEIRFQASSPDEAAVVKGAKELGYSFIIRKPDSVTIEIPNDIKLEYQILAVLEFTSTRKRMSVIVRTPENKIVLYCKGADSMILERLAERQLYVEQTLHHLENCASDGLRTLCFGMKEISQEEFDEWIQIHHKANTSLKNRSEELADAAELIEKNLFLVGATAVEDKLQDEVPETIHILAQAGIKIWVLTGDRQETAINIGYSCRLLTEDMTLIVCNEETFEETKEFLQTKNQELEANPPDPEGDKLAFIIDGHTLRYALQKELKQLFLKIGKQCQAVICCRVSPLQKAEVVLLVKNSLNSITLAIGDGANDVGMIQAAHIGVGISGEEGLQAARAADFAIGQFRFLKRLLLVHGSWSYNRLSKLILYSFYKNITLYMVQFWFAFTNGFSGQTLYDDWALSLYNVIFTFLPPIMIGVFDQYVSSHMLQKYPELYKFGQNHEFFNTKVFWTWTVSAFLHSILLFVFNMLIFSKGLLLVDGTVSDLWFFGTTAFTTILVTVTLKAALTTEYWPLWTQLSYWGSITLFIIFLIGYGVSWPLFLDGYYLYYLFVQLFTSAIFWLTLFILPAVCLFLDYFLKYVRRTYYPQLYDIVQEIYKFNLRDKKTDATRFTQTIRKLRIHQRNKRNRGFAFSQNETGQADLVRLYDTTLQKPEG